MMRTKLLFCLLLSTAVVAPSQLFAAESKRAAIDAFASEMASHGFSRDEILRLLLARKPNEAILQRIRKPAEALPWHRYRQIFITEKRISQGIAYYQEHQQLLHRVSEHFGVEPEYLVAIMGVETFYGQHQGSFSVLDALYTLAFHYPKRAAFFEDELGHYLQLSRAQGWPLQSVKGSYAGAMGMGQFISSSYRHYGVDFDGDKKVDLFNSHPDMLASIANYFKKHGWRHGQLVAKPIPASSPLTQQAQKKWQQPFTAEQLAALDPAFADIAAEKFVVLGFRQKKGKDYLLAANNFYTITRYNRSPLYARAVWTLANEIRRGVESK